MGRRVVVLGGVVVIALIVVIATGRDRVALWWTMRQLSSSDEPTRLEAARWLPDRDHAEAMPQILELIRRDPRERATAHGDRVRVAVILSFLEEAWADAATDVVEVDRGEPEADY
jgi:hypothetical protein